jgi:hypothetical protein
MLLGISAKTKDRRVNKIAKRLGYNNYEVFYSPIGNWLFFIGYLMILALPVVIFFLTYWYWLLIYLALGCLFSAYLNNSFIIAEKELVVINPNFPFRRIRSFKIDRISKIKIDENKFLKILSIFMITENNYIQIYSEEKKYKFYCSGLNIDAFDENFTEKTLNDFAYVLRDKEIIVEFEV